ncbi:MAG: UvrB/UvrC motif-containing protein [Verrucomicrobia bacterium]|nr:UvrB/UvrC motif-containing protein [Verrucomicrobiota bacterium]
MLCNVCKLNEATVHLTQIVGEKMHKVDLCEACSKEKGATDPESFSIADLLLGLGAAQEMEQAGPELKCPACGFTQSDFKKSGRFGCAECYRTFSEGLEALLKSMHEGTKHVGKAPLALQQSRDAATKLKQLEKRLQKAVTDEDYETAATLRDEIKHMREKLGNVPA